MRPSCRCEQHHRSLHRYSLVSEEPESDWLLCQRKGWVRQQLQFNDPSAECGVVHCKPGAQSPIAPGAAVA